MSMSCTKSSGERVGSKSPASKVNGTGIPASGGHETLQDNAESRLQSEFPTSFPEGAPVLTIGVPVYNGEATLARALDSLLGQTRQCAQILIGDNASTDGTREIAERYVAMHDNVQYFRHDENIGPVNNFHFLLKRAETEFFMWAAADDERAPTYVERCLDYLEAHPDYVLVQSRVLFTEAGYPRHIGTGTYSLDRNFTKNISRFLKNPADNSRYYGIFRTTALQRSFPAARFFALDWAVSATTLKEGKHHEIPEILMVRSISKAEAYQNGVLADHSSHLFRMFPALAMSIYLVRKGILPRSLSPLRKLFRLNVYLHFALSPYRSRKLGYLFATRGSLRKALASRSAELSLRLFRKTYQSRRPPHIELIHHDQFFAEYYGFYEHEQNDSCRFRWTLGRAEIRVDTAPLPPVWRIRIQLQPFGIRRTKSVSVHLNFSRVADIVVGSTPVTVEIDADQVNIGSEFILSLETGITIPPGDTRSVGVAVSSVALMPKSHFGD